MKTSTWQNVRPPRETVMAFSIQAWVDGSCWNKTGQGGWCSIVVAMRDGVSEEDIARLIEMTSLCHSDIRTDIQEKDSTLRVKVSVLRGYAINTTNNRMEMRAILESVKAMSKPCVMKIVSDSKFAIGAFTDWHVKANMDLVREWREVSRGFKVSFEHVNGHSGRPLNEWADKLADYRNNPNL